VLGRALSRHATGPVEAFKRHGEDFIVAARLDDLVRRMNALTEEPLLDPVELGRQIEARDRQVDNAYCKDAQILALRGARSYIGDRLIRTASPHRFLDDANGPLIAVRLRILTRKTLGGLETDLGGRVMGADGAVVQGLFAAGEAAGFGGGGMHGYRALEGTFLGGCIFSGRTTGRVMAGIESGAGIRNGA
jgi:predicted oxidoreductase